MFIPYFFEKFPHHPHQVVRNVLILNNRFSLHKRCYMGLFGLFRKKSPSVPIFDAPDMSSIHDSIPIPTPNNASGATSLEPNKLFPDNKSSDELPIPPPIVEPLVSFNENKPSVVDSTPLVWTDDEPPVDPPLDEQTEKSSLETHL